MAIENDTQSIPLQAGEILIDGERYITDQKLCDILKISVRTLGRWHKYRQAPPRITVGRKSFYRLVSVREWLTAREAGRADARRSRRLR